LNLTTNAPLPYTAKDSALKPEILTPSDRWASWIIY